VRRRERRGREAAILSGPRRDPLVLHVDVADFAERGRDVGEVLAQRHHLARQRAVEEADRRAHPARRDAHLVQVLRIVAEPRAGLAVEEHGELAAQRRERGLAERRPGRDRRRAEVGRARQLDASRGEPGLEHRLPRLAQAESSRQLVGDSAQPRRVDVGWRGDAQPLDAQPAPLPSDRDGDVTEHERTRRASVEADREARLAYVPPHELPQRRPAGDEDHARSDRPPRCAHRGRPAVAQRLDERPDVPCREVARSQFGLEHPAPPPDDQRDAGAEQARSRGVQPGLVRGSRGPLAKERRGGRGRPHPDPALGEPHVGDLELERAGRTGGGGGGHRDEATWRGAPMCIPMAWPRRP
jgi:hypothetical protein